MNKQIFPILIIIFIALFSFGMMSDHASANFHLDEYGRPSNLNQGDGGAGFPSNVSPTVTPSLGSDTLSVPPPGSGTLSTPSDNAGDLPNPIGTTSFVELLNRIAYFLLIIAVPIATIIIIYGAFLIMTAGGIPANLEKGKKAILYAVIGLAILFLARVIMALLAQLLGTTINF
ncbi:MAG: hypothetical protein HYT03_00130 [Candidatus Harrisonbacteria bacterium]|nr:hypothetical protein [Candidatus Harrisonbacteria bacterium]